MMNELHILGIVTTWPAQLGHFRCQQANLHLRAFAGANMMVLVTSILTIRNPYTVYNGLLQHLLF